MTPARQDELIEEDDNVEGVQQLACTAGRG